MYTVVSCTGTCRSLYCIDHVIQPQLYHTETFTDLCILEYVIHTQLYHVQKTHMLVLYHIQAYVDHCTVLIM